MNLWNCEIDGLINGQQHRSKTAELIRMLFKRKISIETSYLHVSYIFDTFSHEFNPRVYLCWFFDIFFSRCFALLKSGSISCNKSMICGVCVMDIVRWTFSPTEMNIIKYHFIRNCTLYTQYTMTKNKRHL